MGEVSIYYLNELPPAVPALNGWLALPMWGMGNYVGNTPGGALVSAIVDDLMILKTVCQGDNFPIRNDQGAGGTFFRRWRWLHYTNVKGATPQLLYNGATEVQTVNLPNAYVDNAQTWKVYDLDSATGLYPGMSYWLPGVQAALEDVYV
jgi:hypothetical protein